jgi:hypothetical protein
MMGYVAAWQALAATRPPKLGLPDFGNLKVSKSATADFDGRNTRMQRDFRTGNDQSLGPRRINSADDTPISGRDFIDQHVCRRVSWHLSDRNDDIVDSFDDLAPLILRERPFRHIDFGDWHTELLLAYT